MTARGIFGGSFDPPHLGHITIAEHFIEELGLDIVTWIPANVPPHKDKDELSESHHRLAMVKLAIANNPAFEVSDIEINEDQPPWTIFLLRRFREMYPDDKLHLLIGGDSLAEFTTWRDYQKLWEIAEIDVALRPGWELFDTDPEVLENIRVIECPLIDISGTEIRDRARRGESIQGLVPESVREYIIENGLYSRW